VFKLYCQNYKYQKNRNIHEARQNGIEKLSSGIASLLCDATHHPTPQIIDLERSTLTGATVTPSYEHPARRTDVVKPMKHYDTE